MTFQLTEAERTYVQSTPLARLATSSPRGEPDIAAVMTIFHGGEGAFLVGGLLRPEKKWSWGIEDPSFVEGQFTLRVDDAPAAALDA